MRKTETLVHQNFTNSGTTNTLIVISEEQKSLRQYYLLVCYIYNTIARESGQEVGGGEGSKWLFLPSVSSYTRGRPSPGAGIGSGPPETVSPGGPPNIPPGGWSPHTTPQSQISATGEPPLARNSGEKTHQYFNFTKLFTLYVRMLRFRLEVECSFWSSLFTSTNTCCITASCLRSSLP